MPVPAVELGHRDGPFEGRIDADLIRAYAAATGDSNPLYAAAEAVPPVAVVTQIFDAQTAGNSHIAPEVRAAMLTGVHGEHDIVYTRPIEPGEKLFTFAEPLNARVAGTRARVTVHFDTYDEGGNLMVQQWWTTVLFLKSGDVALPVGPDKPGHAFPDHARGEPLAVATLAIDTGMAQRYGEVSGDWSSHHFEDEAAKKGGFRGVFLHGLCTMGLCAKVVVDQLAGGDPRQLRRIAVRFASPAYLGDDLTVGLYDAGGRLDGVRSIAFEAEAGGATVISNGRAELLG
jgi:acyl dehydratase